MALTDEVYFCAAEGGGYRPGVRERRAGCAAAAPGGRALCAAPVPLRIRGWNYRGEFLDLHLKACGPVMSLIHLQIVGNIHKPSNSCPSIFYYKHAFS